MRKRALSFAIVSSLVAGCAFWDMASWTSNDDQQTGEAGVDGPTDVLPPLVGSDASDAASSDAAVDAAIDADAAPSYFDTVMADHPLAYWPLDDVDAGSPVDVSGNGVQTTRTGSVQFVADVDARGGRAAYFAKVGNSGGLLEVVDSGPFNFFGKTDYSIEMWFKPSGAGQNCHLATHTRSGDAGLAGYSVVFDPVENKVFHDRNTVDSQTPKVTLSSPLPTSNPSDPPYVHLVATYEASTTSMYLYVNGVQYGPTIEGKGIDSVPTSFSWGGWEAGWKAGGDLLAFWYFGHLDEIAIYGTALGADRVLAHYNKGKQ